MRSRSSSDYNPRRQNGVTQRREPAGNAGGKSYKLTRRARESCDSHRGDDTSGERDPAQLVNIGARILDCALAHGDETYLVEPDATPVSGREFAARVARAGSQLREAGISPGHTVIVCAGRGSRYWSDLVAVWCAGAISVPYDPAQAGAFRQHVFDVLSPAIFIGPATALPASPGNVTTLELSDDPVTDDEARRCDPAVSETRDDDTAAILLTSGTTGLPKGVVLSHRVLLGNATGALERLDLLPSDRLAVAVGFHFTSALSHFLVASLAGASFAGTETKLLPAGLVDHLRETGSNAFGGSPLQARWLADWAAERALELNWLMTSGDNMPAAISSQLLERLPGLRLRVVYGLTEVGGRFCVLAAEQEPDRLKTVGRPIAGVQAVAVDEAGKDLAPGTQGEIYVRGNLLFDGYMNEAEATARTLTSLGLKTGDIGVVHADGNLELAGRADDVFKSAGIKVSCQVIADAILSLERFADCAVVPYDDPMVGAVPCCAYVLHPGDTFDRGTLLRELRKRLPANHIPRRFVEVRSIPRTGSGKLRRGALRDTLAGVDG